MLCGCQAFQLNFCLIPVCQRLRHSKDSKLESGRVTWPYTCLLIYVLYIVTHMYNNDENNKASSFIHSCRLH